LNAIAIMNAAATSQKLVPWDADPIPVRAERFGVVTGVVAEGVALVGAREGTTGLRGCREGRLHGDSRLPSTRTNDSDSTDL
jgi:hypothetical protein